MSIVGVLRQSIPLKDLVRSPAGTVGEYTVVAPELSSFTGSAHIYAERAGGAVEVTSERPPDNQTQATVKITVTLEGRQKLKSGRPVGWKSNKMRTFRGQAHSLGPSEVIHKATSYPELARDLGISPSLAYKNFEVIPDEQQ